ncbi:MAG TPA: DUF6056 family protein [Kofleriaceae bacterium]|nr:DUF6056 family protein [Kofleriaceae bacterium]
MTPAKRGASSTSRRPLVALFAFVLATTVVHAMVAFWTPIQGDDWNHWIWAGRHKGDGFGAFLASHFTFSDLVSYVLARCRGFHVLISPAVFLALVVGLFTVSMRRLPRACWLDVLGVGLTSALVWIAQPSAGVTLFNTSNAALFLYGSAIAVWFFAPVRCNWTPPRALWPVMFLAGYCVGTSTRAIATAMVIAYVFTLRRKRETWLWIAFAGLVIGTILGYANPPWLEFSRVFKRGFEQNLVGQGLVKFIVEEGGEIVSLVAAFALANFTLGMFGKPVASEDNRPAAGETLWWFGIWFAMALWCLFGPRYNEATLLPATCILVIAALPFLLWLVSSRVLRVPVIAFAIGVHVIVWTLALAKYHEVGHEGAVRLATLQNAKPGMRVIIEPYRQIPPDFLFLGEDLHIAKIREMVAVDAFGLRGIEFDRSFRRLDVDPQIALRLEVDAVGDADLEAAHVPTFWSGELTTARKQFELFVKRLRAVTHKKVSARLAITNVSFPAANGRPLLAAWSDGEGVMIPRTLRSSIDPEAQITTRIYRPESREFTEAWVAEAGDAKQIQYHGGSPRFQPLASELVVVIACNQKRCLAIDAFIPRF